MSRNLKELVVTNFRSIKGTLTIPLDAPIVLIHGANGAGKTSIASAIELALTGDVAALRRSDENVQEHLVNRDAESAEIVMRLTGAGLAETRMSVRDGKIEGRALLGADERGFYNDRCYLSQATLGRLLDIYQTPASRDPSNTPLTSFVKSLLGLNQLDALIDGLFPAGHKARMVKLSSDFARADQLEERLRSERREADELQRADDEFFANALAQYMPLRETLGLPEDFAAAARHLSDTADAMLLTRHEARLKDITALQLQWSGFSGDEQGQDRSLAEREESDAAKAYDAFRNGPGARLVRALATLKPLFPDLADPEQTDPERARKEALDRVERELGRIVNMLTDAQTTQRDMTQVSADVRQHRSRIEVLDQQIASAAGDTATLGQALAQLLPHVENDICPVCQRDFGEISPIGLRTHLSEEIARLVGQSERLQSLSTERQQTQSLLASAERLLLTHRARVVSQTDITQHQQQQAILRTAKSELEALADAAAAGTAISMRYSQASRIVALLRRRDGTSEEIRATLSILASTIEAPPVAPSETTQDVLTRLATAIEQAKATAEKQNGDRELAAETLATLRELLAAKAERAEEKARRTAAIANLTAAQRIVKSERDFAGVVRKAAEDARGAIVARVFNDRLNMIWRDLFVRLAPNEPFVPSFVVPKQGDTALSALLETVHRDGGSYGRPGAMLSAGNLNTAALTLFLALHLSVKPELPWLILDDPVQSMDELHISQFAALLRTLSKREERQILIAVHERQLFDYLALELSPAFLGDKLVTIEITKSPEGSTDYATKVIGYEPDRLVA